MGSIFRLDLPGLISAIGHLLIDVGILAVDAARTVLLGFFVGHIVENFDRNSLRVFVNGLLGSTFAEPRLTQVRNALLMSDPLWGLKPHVTHTTLVAEFAGHTACRYAQTTTRSTCFRWRGSCRLIHSEIFEPRFTVKWLDRNGRESTFPAARYHIAKFLETGQPDLRVYAQTPSELRDAIQFANKRFNGMGIRPTWNQFITVPQRTPLVTHSITQVSEFFLICLRQFLDASGNFVSESDDQGQFINDSGLKDRTEGETNITSITPFHVLVQVNDVKRQARFVRRHSWEHVRPRHSGRL